MVGPVAHAASVGEVQAISLILWFLLFLFFASGVFYIRMRVHSMVSQRKGASASNREWWPCVVYHILLIIVIPALLWVRVVPWPALLAYAPAVWRAAAGLSRETARLDLRRLGWSEVALAATFVVILIAAFRLSSLAG